MSAPLGKGGKYIHHPSRPHACQPPRFEAFGKPIVGTTWQCNCRETWVVRYVPPLPPTVTGGYTVGYHEWRVESRRQRRRRLGLRWWQKEKR